MKPFLLVSTRPEEEAQSSEYLAYLNATGLVSSDLHLAEFDLVGLQEIDPADYSGIFVAGSPYAHPTSARGASQSQQWMHDELVALFEQVISSKTPLLVTADATNILGELLGCDVSTDNAEYAELAEIELTRESREDPVMKGVAPAFLAYTNHAEGIDALPEGCVRLARSLNAPIEVFRAGSNVYAVQFNPELDSELINTRLVAYEEAGDSGVSDTESLVTIGRASNGQHKAGQILANFARVFGSGDE